MDDIAKSAQNGMVDKVMEGLDECILLIANADPKSQLSMLKTMNPRMRSLLNSLSERMYWHGLHVGQVATMSGVDVENLDEPGSHAPVATMEVRQDGGHNRG